MSTGHWNPVPTRTASPPNEKLLNWCVLGSVIGIVVLLLADSFRYARLAAGRNHAILMMLKVRDAIQGFNTQYSKMPAAPTDEKTALETKGPLLAALLGKDPAANPENVVFLSEPFTFPANERSAQNTAGEWELRDAWGNLFRIYLDLNGDGKVPSPEPGEGVTEVAVMAPGVATYSAGPDGNYDTWQDNVCSWK